jgi:hypothetical protein
LIARVTRDRHASSISILDIQLTDEHPEFTRLLVAYRRWLGIT